MTALLSSARYPEEPVAFLPGVHGHDASAQYWLAQVTLRLRREVCWLWRERALQGAAQSSTVPAPVDRALAALDLVRYERDKRSFFAEDVTALYLSERIGTPAPLAAPTMRGSFGWVAHELRLEPVECFVLAMALLPSIDSAAGPVIASCLNEPARTRPTLALAQRLWDEPDDLLRCFDPAHALLRHGLLAFTPGSGSNEWQAALEVPPLAARELLFAGTALPSALDPVTPASLQPQPAAAGSIRAAAAESAKRDGKRGPQVIPVLGAADAPLAEFAAACAQQAGMTTVQPSPGLPREHLAQALTAAWLRGHAVYVHASLLADAHASHAATETLLPLPGLPLTLFVGMQERALLPRLGATAPALVVPPLGYAERLACWREALPARSAAALAAEFARRFRYERAAIKRIGAELAALGHGTGTSGTEVPGPSLDDMLAAARADLDLGALAQPVTPRFGLDELMLPAAQAGQIQELVAAMTNLTRVHYEWGAARAWGECGLAALFAGPPGTGKTMAAEAIAQSLGLPLYRIDLSQVVNKYIGETEKNLRRLFDAADATDLILFFDEADALFGKRTEVRDAHDRYANIEVSYLLERMERFKGLAILATNRKKDLDEAFLRRLRFVIEFPLPGVEERLRIWRSVIPENVDATDIDFGFLAQRFALAGGHIRAIVFQACLQSACEGAPRRLTMPALVRAVQREYDKLERANSLDQFGPYAALVASHRTLR
jgi:vesicle-fusing ATPase